MATLRTYRQLRRTKEAAYRAGMRDEVMKCEDVKQFFTLLRQFDTDRRGTTDLAPPVDTLAEYFAASPGAAFVGKHDSAGSGVLGASHGPSC